MAESKFERQDDRLSEEFYIIHYVWVGSPTKTDPNAVAGHDVVAPIEMARHLKAKASNEVTLKFWCLNDHIAFYASQFAEARVSDKIQLCSIEVYLTEKNNPESKVFQKLLSKTNLTALEKVTLKDGLSIDLLATQGGFFLDTNIFPSNEKAINLRPVIEKKQTLTVRSPDGRNDFYIMYSPEPNHPIMQEVLKKWLERCVIANLDAFKVSQKILTVSPEEFEEMGLTKLSYKSYARKTDGLFFWLNTEKLIPYYVYGDINQTCSCPTSIKPLSNFSLFDVMDGVDKPSITEGLGLIYVADEARLYFVNTTSTPPVSTLLNEEYSEYLTNNEECCEIVNKDSLLSPRVINLILTYKGKLPYIGNVENCTLLHHGVLTGNLPLIKVLVEAGARQDIKATYRWHFLEDVHMDFELTPGELARKLGNQEVLRALHNLSTAPSSQLTAPGPYALFEHKRNAANLDLNPKTLEHGL